MPGGFQNISPTYSLTPAVPFTETKPFIPQQEIRLKTATPLREERVTQIHDKILMPDEEGDRRLSHVAFPVKTVKIEGVPLL